ncbi:hypothetical protein R3M36_004646 [Salmonella enterica]|nr:hypothetical protein [Salmonella enterica]
MATLKDHQQAMVDLLASGSGIPASASRLAHAMHDVLEMLNMQPGDAAWRVTTYNQMQELFARTHSADAPGDKRPDATTPGLNDKALAADVEVCGPKATPAERRVKELQNTINQLRASNAKLKQERDEYKAIAETHAGWIRKLEGSEQAGCRKPDTQVCEHERGFYAGFCADCGTQRQETKYRD